MNEIPARTDTGIGHLTYLARYPDGSVFSNSEDLVRDSFSEEVRCGQNIKGDYLSPNPWSYAIYRLRHLRGRSLRSELSSGTRYEYQLLGSLVRGDPIPWMAGVGDDLSLYSVALSRLNEMVRSSADLSVAIGQGSQTLRMMNLIASAKRYALSFKNWRALVSGISSARLEWSYGWKPLINDIFGTLEAMLKETETRFLSLTATSSSSFAPECESSISLPYQSRMCHVLIRRSGRHVCKIGIKLKNPGLRLDSVATLSPAGVLWELVPYSFVIDWFFDVGSYLRNVETALLYDNYFDSGYVSRGTFMDATALVTNDYSRGSYHESAQADSSLTIRRFNRSVLKSYPLPDTPRIECDLGSGQLLNLSALLAQKIKRH